MKKRENKESVVHNSETSEIIDPSQVQYSPTIRLFDPHGRVFYYQGEVYRGVYPKSVDFVTRLFSDQIVTELIEKKLLIGTYLTKKKLAGFGLVLQHDPIEVITRPKEWPVIYFINAAKLILNLFRELNNKGVTLIDGHSSNVSLAPGGQVIWHDFGSIVKAKEDSLQGLSGFLAYFYYPLMLYKRIGYFPIVRRMYYCDKTDYYRITSPRLSRLVDYEFIQKDSYWAKLIINSYDLFTNKYFRSTGMGEIVRLITSKVHKEKWKYKRVDKFIDVLFEEICHIPINFERTRWSGYYDKSQLNESGIIQGKRQETIFQLLKEIKPSRVLDLGSNQGIFSHIAYRVSPCVISLDYDETAVALHARKLIAKENVCHIYPVLLNVAVIDEDAVSRFKSHTVMALALTHHLNLTEKLPFHIIAKILSDFTENVLITEFMPNGLGITQKAPDPLPDDYNLNTFLEALAKYFRSVKIVDYDLRASRSPRTMVICKK